MNLQCITVSWRKSGRDQGCYIPSNCLSQIPSHVHRSALRAAARFSIRIKRRKKIHVLLALHNKYSHARIRRPQTVNPRICSALQRVVRLDLPFLSPLALLLTFSLSLFFPQRQISCGFVFLVFACNIMIFALYEGEMNIINDGDAGSSRLVVLRGI